MFCYLFVQLRQVWVFVPFPKITQQQRFLCGCWAHCSAPKLNCLTCSLWQLPCGGHRGYGNKPVPTYSVLQTKVPLCLSWLLHMSSLAVVLPAGPGARYNIHGLGCSWSGEVFRKSDYKFCDFIIKNEYLKCYFPVLAHNTSHIQIKNREGLAGSALYWANPNFRARCCWCFLLSWEGAFLGKGIAVRNKQQGSSTKRENVDSNLDNISCITFPLCNYPWCKGKSCVNNLSTLPTGEEESDRVSCQGEKPKVLDETLELSGNGLLQKQPRVSGCCAFLW